MELRIARFYCEIARRYIHYQSPNRGFHWSWTDHELVTDNGGAS